MGNNISNSKNSYGMGYAAYANTTYGYEYINQCYTDQSMSRYLPEESLYTSRLADQEKPGFLLTNNYFMFKKYYPDGTSASGRPHNVCQMLLFENGFREDFFYKYMQLILNDINVDMEVKEISVDIDVNKISKLKTMPLLGLDTSEQAKEIADRKLALRETLLLIQLILRYQPGRHIDIVWDKCRSGKEQITLKSLVQLLGHVFPEHTISFNSQEAIADFSFNCSEFDEILEIASLANCLEKNPTLKKAFGTVNSAAAFVKAHNIEEINDLHVLEELAKQYCAEQNLSSKGIRKMDEEDFLDLQTVENQFKRLKSTPEAKNLLLKELEQSLGKGTVTWKNLEYIVGILTICFRYSDEEFAEKTVTMPMTPLLPYDAAALMKWVQKHKPGSVKGHFVEKKVINILSDFCLLPLDEELDKMS